MEKQDAANPALRRRPETSRGGRQMPGNRSTRLSRLEARGSQIGAAPPRSLRMHVRSRTAGRQEKQSRTERRPLPSSVPAASDGTLRAIILTVCIAYWQTMQAPTLVQLHFTQPPLGSPGPSYRRMLQPRYCGSHGRPPLRPLPPNVSICALGAPRRKVALSAQPARMSKREN